MFTRLCLIKSAGRHHESGTARRNKPSRSQRPRCVLLQRNLAPTDTGRERGINISGVDFWHAVEFSRNGRFLCTHPLGLSSGLPFGLAFPTLSDRFPIRFPRRFPGFRFRVSLSGDSDFIRSSESEFPPRSGWSGHAVVPGSPSGGAVNVLERGAPMQIGAPRSGVRSCRGVRPRRRREGSSGADGRCRRPTCPPSGG